jgi:uncharacterized protein YggE
MNRTITIKGTGKVSVKPDLIIITMCLESHDYEYEKTMKLAAESINILQNAIEKAGFNKDNLKTTDFNIRTHYESYRDKDNNYKSRFDGYICEHGLKLEFDFDTEVLSNLLTAIGKAMVEPNLNIQFSVKDKDAVNEELLIRATENAKSKAEILTKASNVTLGDLISIDYNWGDLYLYSNTNYNMEDRCMAFKTSAPDITPDDIDVSDTVTFVWEIK